MPQTLVYVIKMFWEPSGSAPALAILARFLNYSFAGNIQNPCKEGEPKTEYEMGKKNFSKGQVLPFGEDDTRTPYQNDVFVLNSCKYMNMH